MEKFGEFGGNFCNRDMGQEIVWKGNDKMKWENGMDSSKQLCTWYESLSLASTRPLSQQAHLVV